ncbi:MAG: tRNA lysidine(34) synthetase TilS [Sphingomicrobium sp.]|nr:tRNA lysidine(34) synthetase TilS [Sphingomonadales bacterium]
MNPAAAERFERDLAPLAPPGTRLGLAVSGGPDSLALLLLAADMRPGEIEAVTVDHRLRSGSVLEAQAVAAICAGRGIPHAMLAARWSEPPTTNLQARARIERYELLADWAYTKSLDAVVTAHHADDQAETLLLRLARGSGVAGLGGVRPSRPLCPGVSLIRPLLGWRRAELATIVADAALTPADDPSNRDPRHERARMRAWLADADWADAARLAATAACLRDADDALVWTVGSVAEDRLTRSNDGVALDPAELPRELKRRLLLLAFDALNASPPNGPDLARAMASLEAGRTVTLGHLKLEGGALWRLSPAPKRRA